MFIREKHINGYYYLYFVENVPKPDFNSCGGTMCEQFSQVIDFIEREFSGDFWCGAK